MNGISDLLSVADAYGEATGYSISSISTIVFRDGKRLKSLRAGAGLTVRNFEHAMRWFSDNWPEGVEWPSDVLRPEKAAA